MKTIINVKEIKAAMKEINKVKTDKDHQGSETLKITAGDKIELITYNRNATLLKTFEAAEMIESGAAVVEKALFNKIISKVKVNEVTLEVNGDKLELTAGNATFNLDNIAQFPKSGGQFDEITTIETDKLKALFKPVVHGLSKLNIRPVLQGVFTEFDQDGIKATTTDSHRLAHNAIENNCALNVNLNLHGDGIKILDSIVFAENVTVSKNDAFARITDNETELYIKIIEGDWPQYDRLFPTEIKTTLTIAKTELVAALENVKIITTDNKDGITKLAINENILLSYKDQIQVDLEAAAAGENLEIWFNPDYMLEALKEVNNNGIMKITFTSPSHPFIMTDTNDDASQLKLLITPIRTPGN